MIKNEGPEKIFPLMVQGPLRTVTENGASAYTAEGVGDLTVALWSKLVRGCPRDELCTMIRAVMEQAHTAEQMCTVGSDLLVMAFQTRDVRNGKGERQLFYWMLLELYQLFPEAVLELLGLIGRFGCWKDVKLLLELAAADDGPAKGAAALRAAALDVIATQLRADVATAKKRVDAAAAVAVAAAAATGAAAAVLQGEEEAKEEDGPSLCAKWAPREGQTRFKEQATRLALRMFPPTVAQRKHPVALHGAVQRARKRYRQLVASLNRDISTAEIRMSEGEWGSIVPHALPAACLRTKKAALLNRPATKGALARAAAAARRGDGTSGAALRNASDDPERVACALRMMKHLAHGGAMHGRTLSVHQLVNDVLAGDLRREFAAFDDGSGEFDVGNGGGDELIVEAQWADARAAFEEMAADPEHPCSLGRYVALSDVSGSMHGDPMAVAIGLGILISEVSHPAFRDRFMTFESTPAWHSLGGCATFHEKVRSAQQAPWGGSTNLGAAMDLLLETCVAAQLPPCEVPEGLIVISDMQFDAAHSAHESGGVRQAPRGSSSERACEWADEHTRITAAWQAAGYAAAPTIVFWNVRGDTRSFPATADTPGVEMVSGFSQNLLKLFLEGEKAPEEPQPEEEAAAMSVEEGGAGAAVPELSEEGVPVAEGAEAEEEEGGAAAPTGASAPPSPAPVAAPVAVAAKPQPLLRLAVTPLATMRRALDAAEYAPIRAVCDRVLREPGATPAVERATIAALHDDALWAACEAAKGAAAGGQALPPLVVVLDVPAAAIPALVGRGGRAIRAIEDAQEPRASVSVGRANPGWIGGAAFMETVEVRVTVAAADAVGEAVGACEASVRAAAAAIIRTCKAQIHVERKGAAVRCREERGGARKRPRIRLGAQ